MAKKLTALLIVMVTMFTFVSSAFAEYGNTIPSWAYGSRGDLIYIKRPESRYASTSDKTYTISAVGAAGTNIKVYKDNSSTGTYNVVKGQTQIGASGLYSVVVDLNDNSNSFKVYAWNGYGDQVVDVSINKIKKSTVDRLKGITVTIKNFFG